MGYYSTYKAVFDRVKSDLEAVSNLKQVVLGERFRLTNLPLAVINPEETRIEQATFGTLLQNWINWSVIVVIRETEPADWFTEILSPMGDVMDKILSDRTLNGTVKDTTPTQFSPGEIRTRDKLYYGGILRFRSLLLSAS